MKTMYIGLLGCGNIGSGVAKLLGEMAGTIRESYQIEPVIKSILVRDLTKQRPDYVDQHNQGAAWSGRAPGSI